MKARILFVEDDDTFRSVLEREMRDFGFEVVSHPDAEAALAYLRESKADVALLDLRLPGMTGLELLDAIRQLDPNLPAIFLTGHGALPDAVKAMRAGAYDFLLKPAPLDELELVINRALEHRRLLRQNRLLRGLVDRGATSEILGESSAIQELRSSIVRIAASDANVLVFGENGTGKELVARAIHAASARSESAFVVVNCGAIPGELFESELFGHCRGAFTGANKKRLGLIELAEGGTLFLDEVGELPLALQPALLRAVQFGEFRPVGAERSVIADVRVLAATNRDLGEALNRGDFREDLYHRISTLGLTVPPLRERGDDVKLLAESFLQRHNEKVPTDLAKTLSPAALDRLCVHPWTGNVRELENVIVRLAILLENTSIEAADVDDQVRPIGTRASNELASLDLEALERAAVVEALKRHDGNRRRAAAELGVVTKTLYNKIRQHVILSDEWS